MDRDRQRMTGRLTRRVLITGLSLPPLLAACRRQEAGGPAPEQAPQLKGNIVLRILINSAPGPETEMHDAVIAAFEERFPNAKVDAIRVPNDAELTEKLRVLHAAGDPPDLYWNRVRTSLTFIAPGLTMGLGAYIKRDKIDLNDFWPSAIKAYTWNGEMHCLPSSASSNAYYFNRQIFEEAGVPTPDVLVKQGNWTWQTLLDVTRRITKGDDPRTKVWGIERNLGLISAVAQFTWQNGGKPFSDDRKEFLLHEPPALEAIQFLVDLVLRHGVAPTPEEQRAAGADIWVSGRQGMILGGRFSVPTLLTVTWQPGMALATTGPKRNATRGDDLGSSIPKGAKQPDAAWEYAKVWSSPVGQAIVMRTGRSYTARRSYARGEEIKQFLRPWEDQETYFRGLEWTEVFPIMPRYPEVVQIFDKHMNAIINREQGVREGMLRAKSEIDPLLKEGWG